MGRESREVWEKRVARWRDSGLSAREFAAEVGVNAGTLAWWASRLRQGEAGEAVAASVRRRRARGERASAAPAEATTAPVKWVEVVGVEGHSAKRDGATVPIPAFELVIGGRTLRVPAGFDADALRRLIAVLEAR